MTTDKLMELLQGAGIHVREYDLEEDHWEDEPDCWRFHLEWDDFNNLITMHRVTTALLAAGCTNAQIVEKSAGSEDEVSHWRELVMEFPRASP